MQRVLDEVRDRIVPPPEEAEAFETAGQALLDAVAEAVEELEVDAEPLLVGSLAKGTWVRDHKDIDCFLCFPPSTPREAMEKAGLEVGHAVLDGRERYAEHPYVHGEWQGHEADVVPCYDVGSPSEQMSAVDRTPFHNRWVVDHLDEDLREDVRYLKQFMHGIGVYGAATKQRGFSGYLVEVLTIALGGFEAVLRAARDWRPGTFLDPAGHAARAFDEPLVVVDPVDGGRNAAAAVSEANLERFAEACAAFLETPDERFFFPHPQPLFDDDTLVGRLEATDGTLVGLTFPRPDVVEDNLYPQLRKAQGALAHVLEEAGFAVPDGDHYADDETCLICLRVVPAELPATYDHEGPPVGIADHADRFRDKWEDHPDAAGPVEERDGRLVVEVRREHRDPDAVLAARLDELSMGAHVGDAVRRDRALEVGEELIDDARRAWLSDLLDETPPWERDPPEEDAPDG